jgi:4'-phosphopantetheinyl transferase
MTNRGCAVIPSAAELPGVTDSKELSFQPPSVHVWRGSLEVDDCAFAACTALLDSSEIARARRFHFARDCRRFTVARALLRRLAARYTGQEAAAVRFTLGPHGKPQLATPEPGLCFNLSHSGTQALFVFAADREVGIDLEAGTRLGENWAGLAERIFSAREQAELAALPAARQREAFLNGWTRKEAYLKATGQGLVNGLAQVEVTLDPARPPSFLSVEIAARWSLVDLREHAGLAAALVFAGDVVPVEVFEANKMPV